MTVVELDVSDWEGAVFAAPVARGARLIDIAGAVCTFFIEKWSGIRADVSGITLAVVELCSDGFSLPFVAPICRLLI